MDDHFFSCWLFRLFNLSNSEYVFPDESISSQFFKNQVLNPVQSSIHLSVFIASSKSVFSFSFLLEEMGYAVPKPTKLFMDNQSAISVAKNPEHHGRMKHLDLCFYWLRDKVEQGFIEPVYLQTDQMPADLLTKALPRVKVMLLRRLMGLVL